MNILEAMHDPELFAGWFKDRTTWAAWRAFLATLFGLPLDKEQAAIYHRCTGRGTPLSGRCESLLAMQTEAWLVVGRRGGKSFILALIAVYLATFRDWRPHLAPGEKAVVMLIATDRKQAGVIFGYIRALLRDVPLLARLIENETAEAIELNNGVAIEIYTCSYRTIRGRTVVAALLDELAFWRTGDSANPDTEILAALRPAMATVPGAMLICASSPYARRGALYAAWRDHYGKDGPALVWQAPTLVMNPTIPKAIVEEAYERDPASAAAEFGANFRADIEGFVSREAVEACVVAGRRELPPVDGVGYRGFCDPSGGSVDAMTLAIAHLEDGVAVLDAIREVRAPFSPEAVTKEFAALLKTYRLTTVRGDRYGGEWPRERFREHGIDYIPAGKSKSDIYREALPLLNAGKVELLDHLRLLAQIVGLERRTARGGRDSIDHAPGAHDDIANAALGVLWAVVAMPERLGPRVRSLDDDDPPLAGHWQSVYGGRGLSDGW